MHAKRYAYITIFHTGNHGKIYHTCKARQVVVLKHKVYFQRHDPKGMSNCKHSCVACHSFEKHLITPM